MDKEKDKETEELKENTKERASYYHQNQIQYFKRYLEKQEAKK